MLVLFSFQAQLNSSSHPGNSVQLLSDKAAYHAVDSTHSRLRFCKSTVGWSPPDVSVVCRSVCAFTVLDSISYVHRS